MTGKMKCMVLRELRQRIADEYGIPFVSEECHFDGDCSGTCPKCEEELRYLEECIKNSVAQKKTDLAEAFLSLDSILSDMNRELDNIKKTMKEEVQKDRDMVSDAYGGTITTGLICLADDIISAKKEDE